VRQILEHRRKTRWRASGSSSAGCLGPQALVMQEVLSLIQSLAPAREVVVLVGGDEKGTGKELAAREFHHAGTAAQQSLSHDPWREVSSRPLPRQHGLESQKWLGEKGQRLYKKVGKGG